MTKEEWHRANIEEIEGKLHYCDNNHDKSEPCNYRKVTVKDLKDIIKQANNSLLEKYMRLVVNEEGVSFTECMNDAWSEIIFTEEEKKVLKAISKKIYDE